MRIYRIGRKKCCKKGLLTHKYRCRDNLQPSSIARFKQEYELIKDLDLEGVIKTFDIIDSIDDFLILQENFDGISPYEFIQNQPIETDLCLHIAILLSDTLRGLYEKDIIHKAISPWNIYFNKKTGVVKISNFGIIYEITREHENLLNMEVIKKILPYISPEQTGRINISIDHRTDLYSLGTVLYEMLTCRKLFESYDPLEIIYSHIAKIPVFPSRINPNIPDTLSDIILKLLSKAPDERYQSASGLRSDLVECLKQFKSKGKIHSFNIAQKDFSDKFIIPQKLYGRDTEKD